MKGSIRVRNVTRDVDLVTRGWMADTFWTRLRGLIGRRGLKPGEGLVIRPCKGVHMWFMRFPIDVLYVGADDRVLDIDEDLRPWAIGRLRRASRYVVELPAGTVHKTGTRVGDKIQVIPPEE